MCARLHKNVIMEGNQCLKRCIRRDPAYLAHLATGCIEHQRRRIRTGSFDERVHRPSIAVLTLTQYPLFTVVNTLPNLVRLVGHYTGTVHLVAQQTADSQRLVTNLFCAESDPRSAGEEP